MKLKVNYFDNSIDIFNNNITTIEILNKKYFYRLIKDLMEIEIGIPTEDIIFSNNNEIINLSGKINIITDYFQFNFDSKKYNNFITKYVANSINDNGKNSIIKNLKNLNLSIKKELNKFDLPLSISNEETFENIIKSFKIVINNIDNDLLENLLLIIDIEKTFKINNIIVFVNLKQLLTNDELVELYKYAIYNEIKLIMIDSNYYENKLNYENKLIINDDLTEFIV